MQVALAFFALVAVASAVPYGKALISKYDTGSHGYGHGYLPIAKSGYGYAPYGKLGYGYGAPLGVYGGYGYARPAYGYGGLRPAYGLSIARPYGYGLGYGHAKPYGYGYLG